MADYRNYNADRTRKLCHTCKGMLPVEIFRLKSRVGIRYKKEYRYTYRNNVCQPCETEWVNHYRRGTSHGVAAEIVRRTKYVCHANNLPFDLTWEWVSNKLETQRGRCALTGLPMHVYSTKEEKRTGYCWDSVSVDRLKPGTGYTKDNVRFVINAVNVARQNYPDDLFYRICSSLLAYRTVATITAAIEKGAINFVKSLGFQSQLIDPGQKIRSKIRGKIMRLSES